MPKLKFKQVEKRDGRVVDFDQIKITSAVFKALTATKEGGKGIAKKLSDQVVGLLNRRYKKDDIPQIEKIQDIVEEIFIINDYAETAKRFILYREQRRRTREASTAIDEAVDMVDKYIQELDWQVKENANMAYSLQGLNHYVVSAVAKKYWLNKIYPKEVRDAINNGDFHIHDLDSLSCYCQGWDLYDLLLRGFGGVKGKVESKPANHLRTALGQLVNFFYTLQGEAAGAEAVSNFDTLLAPFIRYDNLNYNQVKQAMQEFLFNCAVPTRVGFQCVSEDTEILTPQGWKGYQDVSEGDIIKTFNLETKKIEDQKVNYVFKKKYSGIMYRLKNRVQDQLVSPNHRVVRKKFQTDKCVLETIEEVAKLKSPFAIPIAGGNSNKTSKMSDEQIKLMAWIISEGTIERPGKHRVCYRVSIYQSKIKNLQNYKEIIGLLKHFHLEYSEYETASLGDNVRRMRLNAESSRKIHNWFGTKENVHFIPDDLLDLDERQSKLFIETYLKGDGFEGCKISVTDLELLDDLQIICVNAEYGFTVLKRKPTIGKKDIFVLRLIKHAETYISKVEKVDYKGVIWSPNTKNETIVARRKGKVFITGNTPFINVTLDIKPSGSFAKQPVIIGGKSQKETYAEFEPEMNMLNKAFYECLMEGDRTGSPFTFPIPTVSITKDFDWDNPALDAMWEATTKYGVNYFSNFIQSDMDPEDVRSMCPLSGDEKVLIKSTRGRGLEYSIIRNIYEGYSKTEEYEIYSHGKFVKGKFNKFSNQEMIEVSLDNNHRMKISKEHLNFVLKDKKSKETVLKGKDLEPGMYLPYSLKSYKGEGGSEDMGYFVGAFAGDGSFDRETAVVFSLENEKKKEVIKKLRHIGRKYFGAGISEKQHSKTKLYTLKIHSRAAVGLCKDFVSGKERDKHYRERLFGASLEFRKGVIAGHYDTDGGNRHRIYTSSKKMVESLNMLAATMGTTTSIYKDSREGRLGTDPNYAVLIYQLNRNNYGKIWFKKKDKLWVKIKKIENLKRKSVAYCFEVENGEPMFTVGTTGILTHNCRLRLNKKELHKRAGGLFGAGALTGSIGVVTINLPRIGYLSKTRKEYFDRLGQAMDTAKESLEIKRKVLEDFMEKGLYPYSRYYLSNVKQMRGEYYGNHFSTIGLVGANESLLNFIGKDIGTRHGKKFIIEVLDFMRNRLIKYQKETDNLYNLEATPAEGTSYRLALKDKQEHPNIITAGTKKNPYYTNSTMLPVDYTDDIFEALKLQDEIQTKYTGGIVFHIFVGERISDIKAVKNLIKKIFSNFHLPYLTLTPTFSICPQHGYITGEHYTCPKCVVKQPCEVYSRVVGYIRPVQQWHTGKQEEFKERKIFKIKSIDK